jgi:hypothetical protein
MFTKNGALMGSELPAGAGKRIVIEAAGEEPLKAVELLKDGEPWRRFRPEGDEFRAEFDVECADPSNWYVRVVQADNHLAYSSPIWLG